MFVDVAVAKEPRVLSGRSLQCLARHISTAGIRLAMQLDIPDSTITGLAFDTLPDGFSAADITYRMLLLWKRTTTDCYRSVVTSGDAMVDTLVQAVAVVTGNTEVANVVAEHHRANRELTTNCFVTSDNSHTSINVDRQSPHSCPISSPV